MEIVRTKKEIYEYLIALSHLFLKQVVDITETKNYILVMDTRKIKQRIIPDAIISQFEDCLQYLREHSFKSKEYDGVSYLLILKVNTNLLKSES